MSSTLTKAELEILRFLAFRKSAGVPAIWHYFQRQGLPGFSSMSELEKCVQKLFCQALVMCHHVYWPAYQHWPSGERSAYHQPCYLIAERGRDALLSVASWPPGIRWEVP